LAQDLRFALRILLKHPGFTAVAVLTLSLGIGANAALFSVANTVFLRIPAALTESDRLVALGRVSSEQQWAGFGHLTFLEYRRTARSFSGLAAERGATLVLHAGGQPVPLHATLVTGDYFAVLGVRMERGRDFLPEEDRAPGAAAVAILSDDAWRSHFGADPTILERTTRLNDTRFTVIGIAPPGFRGLEADSRTEVWIPLMMEAEARPIFPVLNSDFFTSLRPVGRLAPGVSLAQAQAEMDVLASLIERPQGRAHEAMRVRLSPHVSLPDPGWRDYALAYLAPLSAAAVLVLLIVCLNLAGLLIARSASRRREIAVRLALGAGRSRLVRQLLGEALVLTVPGALGGLLVARWVTALVRARVARDMAFDTDVRVVAFTALLAVATSVLLALVPALEATRGDPARALRDDRGAGSRPSRLRPALVIAQVAVSLVLCTGAGLLVRTLRKAAAVDVGFETRHLLVASPDLSLAGYSDARASAFYPRLSEELSALPGVRSVSWASAEPVDPGFLHGTRQVELEGAGAGPTTRVEVDYNEVGPRYFETLGLRVLRGRALGARDDSAAPLVAVINEAMGRRYWPEGDPVGRRLRLVLFMDLSPPLEIAGVVPDVHTASLELQVRPEVFVPLAQYARRRQRLERNAVVLVRVGPDWSGTAAVADAVRRLDADLPPVAAETEAGRMADRLSERRLYADLVGLFGILALVLAAVGLYGMLAFEVARRTCEIGVRMALGATRADVLGMVMRQAFVVAAAGVALGLLGSVALTRVLTAVLYGVTPRDPLSFIAAVIVITAAAMLASWLPARRAMAVEPIVALRSE